MLDNFDLYLPMIIVCDDEVGWSAKYKNDPNWCQFHNRYTVIDGCRQRRDEVLAKKIRRPSDIYYNIQENLWKFQN